MLHILEHTLSHTIEDSVKLLPFLFFTYLLMELLEHTTGGKVQNKIRNAGKVGPLWGGLLGIMPQCGFSAAASSLYAGRVITVGTLLAVFLSTSDEMLPIFISESVAPATIIKILGAKVCIAIISGFLAELVYVNVFKKKEKDMDIHVVCEEEHCSCEDGVLKSALKHTFKIFAYILLITFMLTFVIELIGSSIPIFIATFLQCRKNAILFPSTRITCIPSRSFFTCSGVAPCTIFQYLEVMIGICISPKYLLS